MAGRGAALAPVATAAAYAELHCRSNYSFLDGASHPQELVERAGELGLSSLALTDRSGLYGVVRAWEAARELSARGAAAVPRLIYGSELELNGDGQPGGLAPDDALVLLAGNREGYATISRLISRGRLRATKGAFALAQDEVLAALGATRDVVVLFGGPRSRLLRRLSEGRDEEVRQTLGRWREACGDALYLELTRHRRPGEHERSLVLAAQAQALGVPVVATNDVCFHIAPRKKLHDVLSCIRRGCTLAAAGRTLLPNAERRLKSATQMQRLFADLPAALAQTVAIAERCRFTLDELCYAYPVESLAPEEDADASLARLASAGLVARLGSARAVQLRPQLERELRIIAQLGYAGYFLTMWDVVQFCGQQHILCQGRGSAANSLVCYATGITAVSPDQIDMLFERFVSLERREPPDIDLDIEHDRREEVIQYVYGKYGRERAAMVAEVIRYRHRSAVRDVGKVLGLSETALARVSRFLAHGWRGVEGEAARAAGIDPEGRSWRQLLLLSAALVDFPRHLSIHVGGFVLSREALERIVPLERARMAGRTVIAWDKDDLDALKIFKVDLLGLGMLNVIARAFRLITARHGVALELGTVPREDPAVYAMLQRADSLGVFQVESRAQMNMLPRLKPRCFYDLVIEVALVRPGPIAGGMVHPYLRRRRGEERVEYPHPKLRAILDRTLGVPIFQEQVMRIAVAVGGYSPGEADQLRRDMAAWRRHGRMEQHQQRLQAAMCAEGIAEPFARRIIQQIEGFGSYGFPESHAASFAHLVYVSAYLKCHYPAEFAVALINAQPMGFYSVASIVADAHRHGVAILGVDVEQSEWEAQVVDRPLSPSAPAGRADGLMRSASG
ncbi:MAG: error-prone DNA polymerase [Proteobacteria bacterium]|nr:error-prone DNA polymerase [Pseudomonadota bacterium]